MKIKVLWILVMEYKLEIAPNQSISLIAIIINTCINCISLLIRFSYFN